MSHDLLDLLDAQNVPEGTLHALLPNMGLACGRDLLEVMDQGRILGRRLDTSGPYSEVTCPDCLARGDLSAIAWKMMGH